MRTFSRMASGSGFGRNWIGALPAGSVHRKPRTLARRLQVLFPILLILSLFPALPSLAADESTIIYENNTSSTSAVSRPLTDGEYVVWRSTSVSVHQLCTSINVTNLETRESAVLFEASKSSSRIAVDYGYMVVETAAAQCVDNDPDSQVAGGIYLVDLATGESRLLTNSAPFVTNIAIDYPYVAWLSLENMGGGTYVVVKAMDVTSDEASVQITGESVPATNRAALALDGDTVYWAAGYGEGSVGNVARATIGDDPMYFMSLHDTTDVVISGDLMVTLTEGRPLLHSLTGAGTLWLADGEVHNLTTDGRYVFWSPGSSGGDTIMGFDTLTNSRFEVWRIQPEDSDSPGAVEDVNAGNGSIVWSHYGYNEWMTAIHGAPTSDRLPSAAQPDPGTSSPDWTYYPETGHYLDNDFRAFWENNGGLAVFGYPMTEEFDYLSPETGDAHAAQMTERQRFEWHPENVGTPYAVLLGRLGETILQQQGRDWTAFEKADPSAEHYFAETGHAIAPEFYSYWSSHGLDLGHAGVSFDESLALFGYPLSEPMMETNADGDTVLTQYFERAVFEYHPDNPTSSQVLLRRLGAELMVSWGW